MKQRHDQYVALTEAGEDVTWRQRSAHREYKEMQETLKESNKTCTYCREGGHRVLTCPMRLGDVDKLKKINRWWKPLVTKTLREIGFGKGALIARSKWVVVNGEHEKREIPHIVLGFNGDHYGPLDFTGFAEGFAGIMVMDTTTMDRERVYLPPSVHNALFHAAFGVEGHEFGESRWSPESNAHPFQAHVPRGLGQSNALPLLAPSDTSFCGGDEDKLFFPLKKKREINKMFRSGKGEYFTEENTGCFIRKIYPLLKKHKGVK
tara:strand:- start:589 stop:1377 length:789 start_codon:yes stop_codon:yes gene_type:complete